jgi:hypothetical protein
MPLSTLQTTPRGVARKTRGQDGFATSFPIGLFHPLQHAGLSRRSRDCRPTGSQVTGCALDRHKGCEISRALDLDDPSSLICVAHSAPGVPSYPSADPSRGQPIRPCRPRKEPALSLPPHTGAAVPVLSRASTTTKSGPSDLIRSKIRIARSMAQSPETCRCRATSRMSPARRLGPSSRIPARAIGFPTAASDGVESPHPEALILVQDSSHALSLLLAQMKFAMFSPSAFQPPQESPGRQFELALIWSAKFFWGGVVSA